MKTLSEQFYEIIDKFFTPGEEKHTAYLQRDLIKVVKERDSYVIGEKKDRGKQHGVAEECYGEGYDDAKDEIIERQEETL